MGGAFAFAVVAVVGVKEGVCHEVEGEELPFMRMARENEGGNTHIVFLDIGWLVVEDDEGECLFGLGQGEVGALFVLRADWRGIAPSCKQESVVDDDGLVL